MPIPSNVPLVSPLLIQAAIRNNQREIHSLPQKIYFSYSRSTNLSCLPLSYKYQIPTSSSKSPPRTMYPMEAVMTLSFLPDTSYYYPNHYPLYCYETIHDFSLSPCDLLYITYDFNFRNDSSN